jgi:hypothetical protein
LALGLGRGAALLERFAFALPTLDRVLGHERRRLAISAASART